MNSIPYLYLDNINTDPQLMKLLPSDVARYYHALPVASDGRRITIAMANPEDTTARVAVSSAIGAPTCLVKADREEIDQRLSEIWPQDPMPRMRLLVWTLTVDTEPKLRLYVREIAELLQTDLEEVSFELSGFKSFDLFIHEAEKFQPDLIILEIPHPIQKKILLIDCVINKLLKRLSTSILVVKNPHWPLEKILVAVRSYGGEEDPSIDWVVRLSHNSNAVVTILPLLPPVPEMYGPMIQHSLSSLLTSNDPLGNKMRGIAQRLTNEKVDGIFKIRDGPPLEQLRHEVFESDIDLVVLEAEPQNHLWLWLIGEIVNNLFSWFDRPLLIARK